MGNFTIVGYNFEMKCLMCIMSLVGFLSKHIFHVLRIFCAPICGTNMVGVGHPIGSWVVFCIPNNVMRIGLTDIATWNIIL